MAMDTNGIAEKLKANRAKAIVDAAYAGKYMIAGVCCYNLEGIIATVRAAEAKKSPALIQLFPWSIEYANGLLLHAAAEAADKASVPIGVHMDHAQSPDVRNLPRFFDPAQQYAKERPVLTKRDIDHQNVS